MPALAADDAALEDAALEAVDDAALEAAELAADADEALVEALLALDDDADEHPAAMTSANAHTAAATTTLATRIDFMTSPFP